MFATDISPMRLQAPTDQQQRARKSIAQLNKVAAHLEELKTERSSEAVIDKIK